MLKRLGFLAVFLSTTCFGADAQHSAGDTFKDCDLCPEMVVLPTGKGWLGVHPLENPRFDTWREGVFDKPFAMGKFEVLQKEFQQCVDAGICSRPKDILFGHLPEAPVMGIDWNGTNQYVAWLARETGKPYRLPSRNEWEFAARAGTSTVYWWGDDFEVGKAICDGCRPVTSDRVKGYSRPQSAENPSIPPNPFGLYFMLGNVGEWVIDCNDTYSKYPIRNTSVPRQRQEPGDCEVRTFRGGHYRSGPSRITAAYGISGLKPTFAGDHFSVVGFRVALSVQ